MRCFTRRIGKNWYAVFDWGGVSYTHSLKTTDEELADIRLAPIKDTLYRLEHGRIQLPPELDSKAAKLFILSDGLSTEKAPHRPALTIEGLSQRFLISRTVEPNTLNTLTFHFNHLKRILTPGKALSSIGLADLQQYANVRSNEQYRGKQIQSHTIRKELKTLRQAWSWALEMGHTSAVPVWKLKSIGLCKDRGREPFRTYDQIDKKIKRGGLSEEDQARLWETLYLNSTELSELLDFVETSCCRPFILPMIAFVALTGCRRSEMLRSLVDDWDFVHRHVLVRAKKADRSVEFTTREIDIHPRLAPIMASWFSGHPGGQFAITQDGNRLTVDQAAG
jgi:integrase